MLFSKDTQITKYYFKRDSIRKLVNQHIKGLRNHQKILQLIISIELMLRVYLKKNYTISSRYDDLSHLIINR